MLNDKILYSGQTSASKRLDKLEERAREKEKKQKKLSPAAEVVFEFIGKEKQAIQTQVLNYVQTNTTEKDLKSTLLALKFYDTHLTDLQIKLKSLLGRTNER